MKEYLVFHLYGPLASFGDIAVGEYRPTHAHPTKSAILGLVAGALGITRDEEEKHLELHRSIGFGVMVISSGTLMRDYHTVQVPGSVGKKIFHTRKDELSGKKLNTILSTRDYRCDAFYRIVLWKKEATGYSLSDIARAIEAPVFVPYLGRKSCSLSIPMQPEIIQSEMPGDAVTKVTHKLENKFKNLERVNENKKNYLFYQDYEKGLEGVGVQTIRKNDRLISRKRWQFGERSELQMRIGG